MALTPDTGVPLPVRAIRLHHCGRDALSHRCRAVLSKGCARVCVCRCNCLNGPVVQELVVGCTEVLCKVPMETNSTDASLHQTMIQGPAKQGGAKVPETE